MEAALHRHPEQLNTHIIFYMWYLQISSSKYYSMLGTDSNCENTRPVKNNEVWKRPPRVFSENEHYPKAK